MRNTWTHLMVSDTFYFIVDDIVFCPKDDKPYCPLTTFLFKLANKILSLYFLVLVLWFYLVLYVFNCPKSIGCTEQCYQIVITSLLSIKDSRNILISVNYTINLYIFITNLVDNYIIFPYRIFIICPKADPFG